MTKYIIFPFIILFTSLPFTGHTQSIEARYKVTKTIFNTDMNGNQKKVATLQFDGFLYQKRNRTIYYQKPLYLNDYPDGNIHITVSAKSEMLIGVPMDTMQHVYYVDFDSLIVRDRVEISGLNSKGWNLKQHLGKGSMVWRLFPDTKEVNGLRCQRATFSANGAVQWDVWFCPDINVLAGPDGIQDLPGLVVEAYCPISNETYTLESYNTHVSLPDSIFWPDLFNQPSK